ncbi:conserved hypothetical protein [Culex quinquefasciatus]|uniref:Phospholipid/glycerol acyltransferase domain-containing protein n=1 Tax=Culex quinquefasciatus TaxID=7176 RepID=B0WSU4_CULQU|nr:conserved hypothetical protein [Culex quinquefasciatus]|eukprot:XP_001870713.1 conserved hypothetical protein [Culex quinquefasciatus]
MKRALSTCAVHMYSYAGLGITIRGRQARRADAPVLVVSPHSSFLDAVIIYLTGLASPLVRNADANLGKLIDYAQPIYVCREDPNSRQNTIKEIIERANSTEDWPQILIFPEGTCTNRTSLIQFKPGAFYPGVPIQPVLVRYPNKVDTVTWTWEGPDALQLLWRTLTQFHTFCEIEFMPVYHPSEEEKRDPKLYARNVRNLMARELGIPISDYTFDDCKLMTFVKNIHMPYAAFSADVEKLRKTLGLNKLNVEEQVVAGGGSFTDDNSYLTIEEFGQRLKVAADDESTKKLFRIFVKQAMNRGATSERWLKADFHHRTYDKRDPIPGPFTNPDIGSQLVQASSVGQIVITSSPTTQSTSSGGRIPVAAAAEMEPEFRNSSKVEPVPAAVAHSRVSLGASSEATESSSNAQQSSQLMAMPAETWMDQRTC